MRERSVMAVKLGMLVLLLILFLVPNSVSDVFPGSIGVVVGVISTLLWRPDTQWMILLCLGIYLFILGVLQFRPAGEWWRQAATLSLGGMFLFALIDYALPYQATTQALVLTGGMVAGLGLAAWVGHEIQNSPPEYQAGFNRGLVCFLVLPLAAVSWRRDDADLFYENESFVRVTGPWHNPNVFGLLMGTALVLAAGALVQDIKFRRERRPGDSITGKSWAGRCVVRGSCLLAMIFTGWGLLDSYSRGAWIGTIFGLIFMSRGILAGESESRQRATRGLWTVRRPMEPAVWVILGCILVLLFWHCQRSEWLMVHRAMSAANQNDFSWRNRIAGWEGALQIAAEHLWLGAGWEQPRQLYDHYYLSPKLEDGGGIETNSYLMLGATLGLPALVCFGLYCWLTLAGRRRSESSPMPDEGVESQSAGLGFKTRATEWRRNVCHSGAVVLLTGFWFDGGLLVLAPSVMFWILMELGAVEVQNRMSGGKAQIR